MYSARHPEAYFTKSAEEPTSVTSVCTEADLANAPRGITERIPASAAPVDGG